MKRKKTKTRFGRENINFQIKNPYIVKSIKFIQQNPKKVVYVTLIILSAIALVTVLSFILPKQNNNTEISDGNSLTNAQKILITIDKNSIRPGEIKLKANRFYDFNLQKTNQTFCSGITIPELGIIIDMQTINKTVPVRINSSGEYLMKCFGEESSAKIIVE